MTGVLRQRVVHSETQREKSSKDGSTSRDRCDKFKTLGAGEPRKDPGGMVRGSTAVLI